MRNLFKNPFPDQLVRANPLGFGDHFHRFNLFGLQVDLHHSCALKDWLGDLFQLVFKIGEIVGVSEPSQFLNRISLGDPWAVHRFLH